MTSLKDFIDSKKKRIETYTFDGFRIDICEVDSKHGLCYEAWLYHDEIGIKELMFGGLAEYSSKEEFVEMVYYNLINVGYIADYEEEYMY